MYVKIVSRKIYELCMVYLRGYSKLNLFLRSTKFHLVEIYLCSQFVYSLFFKYSRNTAKII